MNDKREVKTNFFDKVIRGIEVMGNKLPNPFLLFMMAWGVILILSQILSGISAVDPATGEKVMIVGMLNPEGLTWVLKNMVGNYIKFSPMGTVLVMMIGLGVATSSGLLNEAMKKLAKVPEQWLVFLVVFVGICGNIASGAASAIVPALAASLFCCKEGSDLRTLHWFCRSNSRLHGQYYPDGHGCSAVRRIYNRVPAGKTGWCCGADVQLLFYDCIDCHYFGCGLFCN